MWDTLWTLMLWGFGIAVVVLILFLGVLVVVVYRFKRFAEKLLLGDVEVLEERMARWVERFPEASEDELHARLIRSECFNAGLVGFFTGLGGAITLPIALPIDILATMRIQTRLAGFFQERAQEGGGEGERLATQAAVLGGHHLTSLGGRFLAQQALRHGPKIFLQAVPLVGGVIGFTLDYLFTYGVGKAALARLRVARGRSDVASAGVEGGAG